MAATSFEKVRNGPPGQVGLLESESGANCEIARVDTIRKPSMRDSIEAGADERRRRPQRGPALSANERETAGRMEFSVEGENEGSRDDPS